MRKLAMAFFGIVATLMFLGAYQEVSAQQPAQDSVVVDRNGCEAEVSWVDGREVATKLTVSVNAVIKYTFSLDDVVGDQSATLVIVKAAEGDVIIARLYIEGQEEPDQESVTITKCPTPTPEPTATITPVPATPIPTAVPATATPVVIEKIVIQPPATGDAGLK